MLNRSAASFERGVRRRPTLLCAIAFGTSIFAAHGVGSVQEPIVVHDFADVGVSLMPPTTAQFDARMEALIADVAGTAAALKPYLVILSNHSKRTIVAYCVSFEMTDSTGRVHQSLVHFNYPNAVAESGVGQSGLPRGREVRPGEARVVGTNYEIMPEAGTWWLADFARSQSERFKDTRKLVIGIDAVIFDDGTLVGEDTSELQQAFEKYLNTTQEIYRSVVSRIDLGVSIDDVFQSLRGPAEDARAKVRGGDWSGFYYVQAAGDVSRARKKIGDDRVRDVFEKAIRQTPFVVKRDSSK